MPRQKVSERCSICAGRTLTNPLGVAAGYDKHAEAIDATFGFGAVCESLAQ